MSVAAAAGPPRRDALGYGIVLLSYLGMAGSAPLVAWADAPAAIILTLRMAFAALALGVVFLRRPMIADWRRPGAAWRLIVMAAMSSLTLLLFFFAVLHTSVAIAMFLLFLMPVWVALMAPRVFHSPREPIVFPALALALAGLTKRVSSSTISMAEAACDTLFVLPLAIWQFGSTGYHLNGRAWIAAAVMGVLCTAIPYTLWIEGTRRVRVEHVTVLGYIEPVAGPIYAIFLVGQMPSAWTVVGGALILGAGLLVVMFGRGEGEASPAAAAEPEPL
jgi:drug/metabolite transporter (DMT)-like permease